MLDRFEFQMDVCWFMDDNNNQNNDHCKLNVHMGFNKNMNCYHPQNHLQFHMEGCAEQRHRLPNNTTLTHFLWCL